MLCWIIDCECYWEDIADKCTLQRVATVFVVNGKHWVGVWLLCRSADSKLVSSWSYVLNAPSFMWTYWVELSNWFWVLCGHFERLQVLGWQKPETEISPGFWWPSLLKQASGLSRGCCDFSRWFSFHWNNFCWENNERCFCRWSFKFLSTFAFCIRSQLELYVQG